jgi:serine/threonine protein kinase
MESSSRCSECDYDISNLPRLNVEDLAGLILDHKYRFESFLGKGAMGIVYRAKHIALDRNVAVKLMSADREPDEAQIKRFEGEALSASRLIHPHIVAVLDFGRSPAGLIYMVIEYIPGETLYAMENKLGPMPVARAYGIMHQVMAAVEEAHNHSVVHRDLKPENVIVTPMRSGEDFAKVLDFGIAVLMDDKSSRSSQEDNNFAGTPGYLAPEHIRGSEATALCDVYALGSMFWEALVGRPAFISETPMGIINKQLTTEPPSLAKALEGSHFATVLDPVLKKAMARDPAKRYQSVAELRDGVADAFELLNVAGLSCATCRRPRDPETNLCSLHRSSMMVSASVPNLEKPRESRASLPTLDMGGRALTFKRDQMSRAVGKAPVSGRDDQVAQIVRFLEGDGQVLELVGPAHSGKSVLVGNLIEALEPTGVGALLSGPDPSFAATPWYGVRVALATALGVGDAPFGSDEALKKAQVLDLSEATLGSLKAIFGCGESSRVDIEPIDADLVYTGFVEVMTRASDNFSRTCIFIEDADRMDRASRRLLTRWLISDHWTPTKVIVSSEAGFLPSTHPGTVVQLTRVPLPEGDDPAGGLGQLSDEVTEVLQTIAALGRDVPIALLEELIDPMQLYLSLDLLSKQKLVTAGVDKRVSPAHSLVYRWADESHGSMDSRRKLHRRILSLMERGGFSVFQKARHARESGNTEKSVNLLERAGDMATLCGDHDGAALDFFKVAVHSARWELLLSDEDPRSLMLSRKLGDALLKAGHKLSALVVFKELLGNASSDDETAEHARISIAALD